MIRHLNNKHFQFINWFPEYKGFHFFLFNIKKSSYALIYEWSLKLGFIEIRKWKVKEKRIPTLFNRINSKLNIKN